MTHNREWTDNNTPPWENSKAAQRPWAFVDSREHAAVLRQLATVTKERDELRTACEATIEALDGLYGADVGEEIPWCTLTEDRRQAFDHALELVAEAIRQEG